MTHRRVWHPDRSLALQEESEESSGRASTSCDNSPTQAGYPTPRRRTARIVRRREPTVEIRATSAFPKVCGEIEESDSGYSTVERNSHGNIDLLYRRKDPEEKDAVTEVCGWRVDEHKYKEMSILGVREALRNTLQSREFPSSRLLSGTRMSRKKKEQLYCFKHMQSAEEYMQHYNTLCSFTVASFASSTALKESSKETDAEERRVSEHIPDQEGSRQGAPSTATTHRPTSRAVPQRPHYKRTSNTSKPTPASPLTELASRIGVQDSIRQPQLLKNRTPPSITKKRNEERDDLVLQAQGQRR